jgi:hypothetical protein
LHDNLVSQKDKHEISAYVNILNDKSHEVSRSKSLEFDEEIFNSQLKK